MTDLFKMSISDKKASYKCRINWPFLPYYRCINMTRHTRYLNKIIQKTNFSPFPIISVKYKMFCFFISTPRIGVPSDVFSPQKPKQDSNELFSNPNEVPKTSIGSTRVKYRKIRYLWNHFSYTERLLWQVNL